MNGRSPEDVAHARAVLNELLAEWLRTPCDRNGSVTIHFHGPRFKRWAWEVFRNVDELVDPEAEKDVA